MSDDRSSWDVVPTPLSARLVGALQPVDGAPPLDPVDAAAMRERVLKRIRASKALTTIQSDEGEWQPFSPKVRKAAPCRIRAPVAIFLEAFMMQLLWFPEVWVVALNATSVDLPNYLMRY